MRFASGLAALLLLTGTPARAEEERDKVDPPDGDAVSPRRIQAQDERRSTSPARNGREQLAAQLAAESRTLERTIATVGDKLAGVDAQRMRRIRTAYRILRTPLATDAGAADRMASARRRAAARLLLERERSERELLATEASHLRAAQLATIDASAKLQTVELPDQIGRPAKGSIARSFGPYEHERSKAILSRRGIDFDVDLHAVASAPADGTVRYSGPIRGLDHGVILDHGDYFTLVAKLDEVSIPAGTHVERGDRLGRAARHRIYLEVRAKVAPGGLPIDPEPLLAQ